MDHEDTPEGWMDVAVREAGAATDGLADAVGGQRARWEEAAALVERLAATVQAGYADGARAEASAAHARAAAAGVWQQWRLVRPRLAHFRKLFSCLLPVLSLSPAGPPRADPPPDPLVTADRMEREARDKPQWERYTLLAEAARLRGDAAAERWFRWRADASCAKK